MPELRVLATADDVAEAAATEIARTLADAIASRGVAHWATTGGSSAPGIYRHLGRSPLRDSVDWSRVHVWWGDDRFVPSDHPLSNALPLIQILLVSGGDEETGSPEDADVLSSGEGVRIPASHLHLVPVADAIARGGGPAWAAAFYAEALKASGPPADGGDPAFDVLAVGVGAGTLLVGGSLAGASRRPSAISSCSQRRTPRTGELPKAQPTPWCRSSTARSSPATPSPWREPGWKNSGSPSSSRPARARSAATRKTAPT